MKYISCANVFQTFLNTALAYYSNRPSHSFRYRTKKAQVSVR